MSTGHWSTIWSMNVGLQDKYGIHFLIQILMKTFEQTVVDVSAMTQKQFLKLIFKNRPYTVSHLLF